jgi:Zn-dependent protease
MGPLMNFIMAFGFLALKVYTQEGFLNTIGYYGFFINAWIGLFNMIPFGMFDGRKILDWNKTAYALMAATGLGLMALIQFL